MNIQYPTWKVRQSPTPSDKLVICPKCGHAHWTTHFTPGFYNRIDVCYNPDCNKARLREATPAEYEQGKRALKEILGS